MEKKNTMYSIKKTGGRRNFDPPLQATHSAIYLPDGSLTCFGRKYMMRKILERRNRKRNGGEEKA